MEKLVNCEIIVNIHEIELISGGNRQFEIGFLTEGKEHYKLIFDSVWDMRYSIEEGYIDRFYNISREIEQKSSVLLVENSDYLKYFEKQVSGTRPINKVKNYILFDAIDTVVEILTSKPAVLLKL